MIPKARGGRIALGFAVANAAVLGIGVHAVQADSYSINTATQGQAEPTSFFTGTSRFSVEGSVPGGATFTSWGLLDFSSTSITNGTSVGLPDLTSVSSVNSMSIKLTDLDESFARAGLIDVYLTSDNSSTSPLRWLSNATPQGIGGQLANGSLGAPLFVGQINYTPAAGTVYTSNFTLNSGMQSYLASQINTGGNIRVLFAADNTTVAADFDSVTSGASTAPTVNFDLSTTTFTPTNSVFTLAGNAKSTTITIPRIVNTFTSNTTLTVTNSGTDAGNYTVNGVAADSGNPLSGAGVGQSGPQPVAASGGTSNITVGISPATVQPGLPSAVNQPATSTVIIHDRTNPGSDGDITVTINATQVVANRLIDNHGGSASGLDFSNGTKGILAGSTFTVPASLETFNASVGADTTTNSLTEVDLPAGAVASKALSSVNTGVKDAASMSAGNLTTFTNAQTETRNITFAPNNAEGGLYKDHSFFDGFLSVPLTKVDTALGATASPTANVYVTTNVYQQANVTLSGTSPTFTLTNALHTVNNITVSNATVDIGARANASVTSVSLVAQGGYLADPGLVSGLTIGDGATVPAASFSSAGKLNGTYVGTLAVGLQNEQDIQGAAPNDLGTGDFSLSTTVTTNSGNGTANILGGSFAGYYINSNLTKNSTIKFLGGTSLTISNDISVNWGVGIHTTLSDKATVAMTGVATNNGEYVLQMSYDPTAVTNGASSPILAENVGGHFIGATYGNTVGTAAEVNGAYSGQSALGTYGIDTTNHVVWAVVNSVGDFESIQRLPGDATGDGRVDLTDLSTVLNNFGTTTAFWSSGNFDGAATIDLTDLSAVLNNFGATPPVASVVTGTGGGAIGTPEPASLGALSLGMICLIKRRR